MSPRPADHRRTSRCLFAFLALAAALWALPSPASADGSQLPRNPTSLSVPPAGYRLSASDAFAIARRQKKTVAEQAKPGPPLKGRVFLIGDHDWLVNLTRGGEQRVVVELNGRTGKVNWTAAGREVDWPPVAHGEHYPAARRLNVALILSGLLFLLPFVDVRRLRRMVHLDLLSILGLGVSYALVQRGHIYAATPLLYPFLLYLVIRLLVLAVRPSAGDGGRLTWMSPRTLGIALLVLLLARYGYDIADGAVSDVGYASLYGADSILNGYPLYSSAPGSGYLDVYGPLAYLAYVPFILVFPFHGLSAQSVDAAMAAAIVFDLGVVVVLYAVGRRLRAGVEGRVLGMSLAWAYAACPWTLFALMRSTNDLLVALVVASTLLVLSSPLWRGALVAAAGAIKFAPLVVAGVFLRAGRERTPRTVLIYAAALTVTLVLSIWAYLPDGGIREFYDTTIGFQLSRTSPFSIWGLHPTWQPLRPVLTVVVAALAAAAVFLPRDRSLVRLAAAGGALMTAVQLTSIHWYWFYVPWLLPYALVAFFSRSYAGSVRNSGSSSASAVATNR